MQVGLEHVSLPGAGRTLRTTEPVTKGQLVIAEPPLVTVGGLRTLERPTRQLYRRGATALRSNVGAFLNLHAYLAAPAATRRLILAEFCSYDVLVAELPPTANMLPPGTPHVLANAMRVASWSVENVPACAGATVEELTRAQLCFELNSHSLAGDSSTADTH
eukprot:COSAG05_NODE_8492_length_699_cov_0.738333_1_plen_161_part_01